jgi:hypothetical protein
MNAPPQAQHTTHRITDANSNEWSFIVYSAACPDVLVEVRQQRPTNTGFPFMWVHQMAFSNTLLNELPPGARYAEYERATLFKNKYPEVIAFSRVDGVTDTMTVGIRITFNRDNTVRLSKGDARLLWEYLRQGSGLK